MNATTVYYLMKALERRRKLERIMLERMTPTQREEYLKKKMKQEEKIYKEINRINIISIAALITIIIIGVICTIVQNS